MGTSFMRFIISFMYIIDSSIFFIMAIFLKFLFGVNHFYYFFLIKFFLHFFKNLYSGKAFLPNEIALLNFY